MLSMARTVRRRGSTLFVILVIAAIAAACGGTASAPGLNPQGNGVGGAPAATAAPAAGPQSNENETDGEAGRPVLAAPGEGLLIIKTGSMVLQVTGIDAALASATQQITALGGYASGSDRTGDGESDQASITFRIPADRWEEALKGLRGLATKILAEHTATDDVTGQVVDLAARIRNLQATELALQGIMDRATEIKDVLAVQAELTTVRGQIEQLTGDKTHLEEQAAYSTLTVGFSLKPDPVLTSTGQFDPKTEVDEASASLVGFLQALATAGIWFAIVWLPILLVLAIVVGIGAVVVRRFRRNAPAADLPMAPPA
jgi:hypothetical protein